MRVTTCRIALHLQDVIITLNTAHDICNLRTQSSASHSLSVSFSISWCSTMSTFSVVVEEATVASALLGVFCFGLVPTSLKVYWIIRTCLFYVIKYHIVNEFDSFRVS